MSNVHRHEIAETEIRALQKTVDYKTVAYALEYFVKYTNQKQIDSYLWWNERQQSYFIESLLLGLPFGDVIIQNNGDELEVIDGKQKICAAINFANNNLRLENLKTLTKLNEFRFSDLLLSRQKKFKRITVQAIEVPRNFNDFVWRGHTLSRS